jgi:hypothetical protein
VDKDQRLFAESGLSGEGRDVLESQYLRIISDIQTNRTMSALDPKRMRTTSSLTYRPVRGAASDKLDWDEFLIEAGEIERGNMYHKRGIAGTVLGYAGGAAATVGVLWTSAVARSKGTFSEVPAVAWTTLAVGAASVIVGFIVAPSRPERVEAEQIADQYNQRLIEKLGGRKATPPTPTPEKTPTVTPPDPDHPEAIDA